ncbi:MAG: hypothetical protein ACPGYF_02695 [Chitinophagales bacterium]
MKNTLLLLILVPFISFGQSNQDEGLATLREALQYPEKVTKLNLSYFDLGFLPPEIGKFSNLKSLDLSNNRFVALPPEKRTRG